VSLSLDGFAAAIFRVIKATGPVVSLALKQQL
jgi:hypothetical protein